ncbi:MAG: NAD(P)/FAD-dependent oxidoreductase [Flavobacteriales bacterium]|nr:NAD(P)/FAD-dependent oxidoreductase [Flavobacteriales bacterium]
MNIPQTNLPRIVIVGGGFAGLNLARSLRGKSVQVVLIDKHNYHTFQPLLYQVATAGLEPDSIAYPFRKIFKHQKRFYFRMGEVESIDSASRTVHTSIGDLSYDYLVLATGSRTNFFGMNEVERHAMSMKEIPEALDIRSLMLQNFEAALLSDQLNERDGLMSVIIVGGGPTGTELAGALAELKRHILPKDYPDLDVRRMSINVVEAAPRVLAAMSEDASKEALEFLENMGVDVWLDKRVKSFDGHQAVCHDGTVIQGNTLIWAAGVQGNPVLGIPEEHIVAGQRVTVDAFGRFGEREFAIGDVANLVNEDWPKGHPMLAQVAIQQGKLLAQNLERYIAGKDMKPFSYRDLGSMATVGRNKAVVDLPRFRFQGAGAWFIWMFIHVIQLIGFRNKLVVTLNWMYNYFRYARDIRLIIRPYRKSVEDEEFVDVTSR